MVPSPGSGSTPPLNRRMPIGAPYRARRAWYWAMNSAAVSGGLPCVEVMRPYRVGTGTAAGTGCATAGCAPSVSTTATTNATRLTMLPPLGTATDRVHSIRCLPAVPMKPQKPRLSAVTGGGADDVRAASHPGFQYVELAARRGWVEAVLDQPAGRAQASHRPPT